MSLEQALRNGLERIKSNQLTNEAQVKQAVILPILRALGWNDSDPNEFVPELSVDLDSGKGSVDYALHATLPNRRPLVFIEAKKLGSVDILGEEQLFRYATNKGVPFLILTDGNIWNFYLAMADGIPAERIVYRVELEQEEKLVEYAKKFELFLEKDRVLSGEARQEAEGQRRSDRNRTAARNAIPGCWHDLLGEPHQSLVDLLVDLVQTKSGLRPDLDDVRAFLKDQSSFPVLPTPVPIASPPKPPSTPSLVPPSGRRVTGKSRRSKIVGFALDGVETQTGAASRTLAEILKEFQRRDQTFMRRFYPEGTGRNRKLVSQNRDDLYDSPHLKDQSTDLGNGWWLGTNISKSQVVKYSELACNIADVSYGTRLTLIYRD